MTMTLDSVPAKLNELDLRAPLEVFEAIEAAIRERADLWSKWQAERCFRAKAEAELAAARETIKRLNRRVQVAEAGIAEKVKASAPGSLGRALANAAADKYMRERDMAQAELAALKARILPGTAKVEIADTDDPDGNPYGWVSGTLLSHNLIGKRVALVRVED